MRRQAAVDEYLAALRGRAQPRHQRLTVWNTRYLKAAAEELARRNNPIPENAWTHLTPLLWEHIHLVGHYRFEEPVITGELRPLPMEEIA